MLDDLGVEFWRARVVYSIKINQIFSIVCNYPEIEPYVGYNYNNYPIGHTLLFKNGTTHNSYYAGDSYKWETILKRIREIKMQTNLRTKDVSPYQF